jgi:hypothetical protein
MLVSTFELLVKPIAPSGAGPIAVARTVVQGYFLTIANPNNIDIRIRLQFTATTPSIDVLNTVTILDVNGTNDFSDLIPVPGDPKRLTFDLGIPANDTALVTLLPDLRTDVLPPFGVPDLLNQTLEVRGYVEISLLSPFSFRGINLLLTPEQRGTFLPRNLSLPNPDFDQLAYSLPTATGSSLFKLGGFFLPTLPPVDAPIDTTPELPISGIEEMFNQMADRINSLEQRLETSGKSLSPQASSNGEQVSNRQASIT